MIDLSFWKIELPDVCRQNEFLKVVYFLDEWVILLEGLGLYRIRNLGMMGCLSPTSSSMGCLVEYLSAWCFVLGVDSTAVGTYSLSCFVCDLWLSYEFCMTLFIDFLMLMIINLGLIKYFMFVIKVFFSYLCYFMHMYEFYALCHDSMT